ncbi:MAG: lysylphosphatidylglycerol synthase transmembrane domain-containing protein [Thermoprotei archaeon]|nr:lysylphosphatidylglycerol synthase transmembrane domain-containing protein [Thermoprotei archaeon]
MAGLEAADAVSQLITVLYRVDLKLLAVALLIYIFSLIISSLRWSLASNIDVGVSNVLRLCESLLVGVFVNNIITFYNITGEFSRVLWASGRLKIESSRLLVGALAERASEIPVALAYVFVIAPHGLKLAFMGSLQVRGLRDYSKGVLRAFKDLTSNPLKLLTLTAFSLLIYILDTARIYVIGAALGVNLTLTVALALTIIHIISRFSLTPAGLGVLEGGFAGYMVIFGYSLADATLVILGERLVSTVVPTIVGGLIVTRKGGLSMLKHAMGGVKG